MSILADPTLTWVARLVLALVLGWAAVAKLRSLEEFVGVVGNYRLLLEFLVRPVAYLLPPVELVLAVGLIVPATQTPAAVATAALLVVFALAMIVNIKRGRTQIDCGCFASSLKQYLSWTLVARNLVLVALAALAAVPAGGRMVTWLDLATMVLATVAIAIVYATISRLGSFEPAGGRRKEA